MQLNYTKQSNTASGSQHRLLDWSDEALASWVNQQQQAHDEVFSILASRHRHWIYRRCAFRLGNPHDAEDATQDILLRVYANLHQFQGRSKFRTWLNTVTDNYCNTFAMRRARYETGDFVDQLIEAQLQQEIVEPNYAPDESDMVRHVLSALPDNARQVLSLRFYGEHSLDEIASILKLTLSAAKARLYRALELLSSIYVQLENSTCPRTTKQQPTHTAGL